jgi:hypothetical protein
LLQSDLLVRQLQWLPLRPLLLLDRLDPSLQSDLLVRRLLLLRLRLSLQLGLWVRPHPEFPVLQLRL